MNFKQKISHFWDYYKWHTLITVFFIAVFTILIVQMVTRESNDIKVMYAGPALISDTQSAEMSSAIQQLMPHDYDGDGEKRAVVNHLAIMTEDELKKALDNGLSAYTLNPQKINENKEVLTSNMYAGSFLIFMLSEDCYTPLAEKGAFVPLDVVGVTEGERYDDCAVYLSSLDASKFFSVFGALPEDTLLCLRKVRATNKGDSEQEKEFEYHKEVFKAFTDFKLPEGFEEK